MSARARPVGRRHALVLEKRAERSQADGDPVAGASRIALTRHRRRHHLRPARASIRCEALYVYFVEPLTAVWSIEQLIVKATPLVLIGVGLVGLLPRQCLEHRRRGPAHRRAPSAGGIDPDPLSRLAVAADARRACCCSASSAACSMAPIPALLKNRFNANEILTSLMLVYVAQLFLDWLVRGPWRDPQGLQFPQVDDLRRLAVAADHSAPRSIIGVLFALVAVVALAFLMGRTLKGFEIRVLGNAPRAGRFAGFSRDSMVMFCFLLSGGLAGLAGICEVGEHGRPVAAARSRPAMASPRSSSPSSAGSIRSACCLPACCWRSAISAAKRRRCRSAFPTRSPRSSRASCSSSSSPAIRSSSTASASSGAVAAHSGRGGVAPMELL